MSKIDELVRDGLAQHQAGRRDAARALYAKALSRQPSHPAANHLLGLLLLQQGEADAAVRHLQRAVRGHRSAEYLGNLGTALNAAGRQAEAIEAFDAALALQPKSPGILNNRGMALKALGRHDEAIASYRQAIALAPGDAAFQRNLGNALAAVGFLHEAVDLFRASLRLAPHSDNAALGLCNALLLLGQAEAARSEVSALAQRLPTHAGLQRAAAHAARSTGDIAGAAACYRRAIAADPRDVEAHRLLGLLVHRTDPADPEILALRRLAEQPGLSSREQAQLGFALGQASQDLGHDEEAFAWFSRANALVHAMRPHDAEASRRRVEAIMQSFAECSDETLPPLASPGPVFIVGLPRSGKSTLETMLARHPQLRAGGELGMFRSLAGALSGDAPVGEALPVPAARALAARWNDMADQLFAGRRYIDTTPSNLELVGLLRQALPSARVLVCRRPPREHAAALFAKYFAQGGNEATSTLPDILQALADAAALGAFWQRRFPGFVRVIDTGGLSDETAPIDDILGFLELPLHAPCRLPAETEPRLGSASATANGPPLRLLGEIDRLLPAGSAEPSPTVHRG
jgi:tetratricopeptide (TPR) repeat protein